jgi:uncharacterized Zn finger protein (UPF0148 family)
MTDEKCPKCGAGMATAHVTGDVPCLRAQIVSKDAEIADLKDRAEKAEKDRDSALETCRILGSLPSDFQVVTCRAEKAEAACLAWYEEQVRQVGSIAAPNFHHNRAVWDIGRAVAEREGKPK